MNGAHIHLLLNHLPIIGTIFGLLLLLYALLRKSDEVKRISLAVFVFTGLAAVPTYLTGEPAEEIAEKLPGVTEALIEGHEDAAMFALIAAIATSIVALAGLFIARRDRPFPSWLALTILLLALATGGLMARTANLGGQIRHTEIRAESAPSTPAEKTGAEARQPRDEDEKENH